MLGRIFLGVCDLGVRNNRSRSSISDLSGPSQVQRHPTSTSFVNILFHSHWPFLESDQTPAPGKEEWAPTLIIGPCSRNMEWRVLNELPEVASENLAAQIPNKL